MAHVMASFCWYDSFYGYQARLFRSGTRIAKQSWLGCRILGDVDEGNHGIIKEITIHNTDGCLVGAGIISQCMSIHDWPVREDSG